MVCSRDTYWGLYFSIKTCSLNKRMSILLQMQMIIHHIFFMKTLKYFLASFRYVHENYLNSFQIIIWKLSSFLSSNDKNKKIENNGEVINKSQVQKLLGVHIDYELKFDTHIKTLKKLFVFSRVIKFTSTNQAQLLMRSFIMSQFSYCPPAWMS